VVVAVAVVVVVVVVIAAAMHDRDQQSDGRFVLNNDPFHRLQKHSSASFLAPRRSTHGNPERSSFLPDIADCSDSREQLPLDPRKSHSGSLPPNGPPHTSSDPEPRSNNATLQCTLKCTPRRTK